MKPSLKNTWLTRKLSINKKRSWKSSKKKILNDISVGLNLPARKIEPQHLKKEVLENMSQSLLSLKAMRIN
jgi:hypothetical protein